MSATVIMTCEVMRVKFKKPGNPWAVVLIARDTASEIHPTFQDAPYWVRESKELTLTGELGDVQAGDLFDIEALPERNERYRTNQLKLVRAVMSARRDERALMSFLRRLPQIGQARAVSIISAFQPTKGKSRADVVFDILENDPQQLTAVSGITEVRAEEIGDVFKKMSDLRSAWKLCLDLGLSTQLTTKILDRLGGNAVACLKEDPFLLMSFDISFVDCDEIRKAMGIPEDDHRRLAAGALLLLQTALRNGDCWATFDHLTDRSSSQLRKVRQMITFNDQQLQAGLDYLAQHVQLSNQTIAPRITVEDGRIYLASVYQDEREIRDWLHMM